MLTLVEIQTRPHEERPQKLRPLADFPSPNVLDKAIISEWPTIHGQRQRVKDSPPSSRRFAKEAVGSDVIATHACHLVSQKSIDSAPLPLRTMTRRSDRSNTKYSIPSPFFDPSQFSVHPSGRGTVSAPVKMMNS